MKSSRVPDFICIGASKAGTTALHHYLLQHPSLFLPEVKESRFFCYPNSGGFNSIDKSASSAAFETYKQRFGEAKSGQLAGEVSPSYLGEAALAERLKYFTPDALIILVLRDPAERILSSINMQARVTTDPLTVDQFVEEVEAGFEHPVPPARFGHWKLWRGGCYADCITELRMHYPESRIRIFLYEDLMRSPKVVCNQIFDALNVSQLDHLDTSKRYNVGAESISPQRARLYKILTTDNALKSFIKLFLPTRKGGLWNRRLKELLASSSGEKKAAAPTTTSIINPELQILQKLYFAENTKLEDVLGLRLDAWKPEKPLA